MRGVSLYNHYIALLLHNLPFYQQQGSQIQRELRGSPLRVINLLTGFEINRQPVFPCGISQKEKSKNTVNQIYKNLSFTLCSVAQCISFNQYLYHPLYGFLYLSLVYYIVALFCMFLPVLFYLLHLFLAFVF